VLDVAAGNGNAMLAPPSRALSGSRCPGVRIGNDSPALRARATEDDGSEMEDQVDALQLEAAQRAVDEPARECGTLPALRLRRDRS
jgi:hypothetical protein